MATSARMRAKMLSGLQPYLRPGEQVSCVFPGQTRSGWLMGAFGLATLFANRYRMIAVTDQRIVVLDTGKVGMVTPTGIIGEFPRGTRIGEPKGLWWRCESLGDPLYVHRRYHEHIRQADQALGDHPLPRPAR